MKTSEITSKSLLELLFAEHIKDANLTEYQHDYRLFPFRRWKYDFCWLPQKLICEIEGGTWTNGRHTRGRGFHSDCEKYNTATLNGYRVLRFDSIMVNSGQAIKTTIQALKQNQT